MRKLTCLILIFLLWSFNTAAFSVHHTFFVTVGAFDASKTSFAYTLTPQNYAIVSNVATNGFFNTLYPFAATYSSAGHITNGNLITTDYSYTSKSRFNTRSKQVFYNDSGIPVYRISAKNGKTKKQNFEKPTPPVDTYELQTIIAKLTKQYNELGFCASTQTVFDGKHRFEVVFTDEGMENIAPDKRSVYSGQAAKCSLKITKELSEEDDTLWQFATQKPIYFWIAKDKETLRPFIVQVKIKETPLGELTAYLTDLTFED